MSLTFQSSLIIVLKKNEKLLDRILWTKKRKRKKKRNESRFSANYWNSAFKYHSRILSIPGVRIQDRCWRSLFPRSLFFFSILFHLFVVRLSSCRRNFAINSPGIPPRDYTRRHRFRFTIGWPLTSEEFPAEERRGKIAGTGWMRPFLPVLWIQCAFWPGAYVKRGCGW